MAELFPFRCDNCKQCLHFSTNLEFYTNHENDCRKKRNSELQKDRRSRKKQRGFLQKTLNIGPSFPLARFEGREFVLKNSTVLDTWVVLQDYFRCQRDFYEISFSSKHIDNIQSWEVFNATRVDNQTVSILGNSQLEIFLEFQRLKLTDKEAQRHLEFLKSKFKLDISCGWRYMKSTFSLWIPKFQTKLFLFPITWNLPDYIKPLEILVFDPLVLIAEILVNPKLMADTSHVKLFPYCYDEDDSSKCDSLMSSHWANSLETDSMIIPFIPYEDGITVDSAQNRSIDAIIGTLGNFSRSLRNVNQTKFVLGFIPQINNEIAIIGFIKLALGCSTTAAKLQLKLFRESLRQQMYTLIFEPIVAAAKQGGVNMMVFGYDIPQKIEVFVPFFMGDIPAARLLAGLKGHTSTFGCITCMYPTRQSSVAYNPHVHEKRNYTTIKAMREIATDFNLKPDTYSQVDCNDRKLVLYKLEQQGLMSTCNAFDKVPMGKDNSVYNSPGDTFHHLLAGIIKQCVAWVLVICQCLSKKHKSSASLCSNLEILMENFPYVSSNIPHVQWTNFKRGMITKMLSNSSKEKDSKATGKGGGIRSSHYLSALIQIYYCLEEQLPKGNITITNKADNFDLGNVRSIIYPTIEIILHLYFELCRESWSEELVKNLETVITIVKRRMISLWNLKQKSLFIGDTTLMSVKLHAISHFPENIRRFGPSWGWDCASTETYLKTVKAHWKQTSHRNRSQLTELMTRVAGENLANKLLDRESFLTGTYKPILQDCKEEEEQWVCGQTYKKVDLCRYNHTDKELYDTNFDEIQKILLHFDIAEDDVTRELLVILSAENTPGTVFLLEMVKLIPSIESGLRETIIHAYFNLNERPCFDFIEVNYSEGSGLAQIIAIFEINEKFYFLLKYLLEIPDSSSKKISSARCDHEHDDDYVSYSRICKPYKWQGGTSGAKYDLGIIDTEPFMRVAFVVPSFTNKTATVQKERFYYMDLKFFDRSGWGENLNTNLVLSIQTENAYEKRIKRPSTSTPDVVLLEAEEQSSAYYDMDDCDSRGESSSSSEDEEE